jgi:hypothetical protein
VHILLRAYEKAEEAVEGLRAYLDDATSLARAQDANQYETVAWHKAGVKQGREEVPCRKRTSQCDERDELRAKGKPCRCLGAPAKSMALADLTGYGKLAAADSHRRGKRSKK